MSRMWKVKWDYSSNFKQAEWNKRKNIFSDLEDENCHINSESIEINKLNNLIL